MLNRFLKLVQQTPVRELPQRLERAFRHHVFAQPDFLLLQCISACNLKCEHCFLTDYGKTIPDGQIKILPLIEVERRLQLLAPMVKKVNAIAFSSFEALLHRDLFKMMDVALAINPRLSFPLLTNGQLVTPEIVSRLENY
jgi:MoaA/NifB/PqqE/SkfB family radical SAM enzyme